MPKLLTTKQVADYLRLTPETVDEIRAAALFPYVNIQGVPLFPREEVIAFLNRNRVL